MILCSRSRFSIYSGGPHSETTELASTSSAAGNNEPHLLGPVWRMKYPSRFNRDALCCDIFWHGSTRIRLVNVHLDSLPIQPNQRPRQVAIAGSLLRTADVGRGVIAGDWNPVSKEDLSLVQENSLTDAWEQLHPGEDGFTWGLDGKGAPFPPARLDKFALIGLKVLGIGIVHPGSLKSVIEAGGVEKVPMRDSEEVPWSDHSGLVCDFIPS